MRNVLITLLAPHYCCSCGAVGGLLCDYCKYDIINDSFEACILCHKLARPTENSCMGCKSSFAKAWCAGSRSEGLKVLLNRYKFERARAAYLPLAELLDSALPTLPSDMVIVPVPTIAPHIRERGYDQTVLLAKQLARRRGASYAPLLRRKTNSVQRGATRKQRIRQAGEAFTAKQCVGRYLVVDDISTTGSTLNAAAKVLMDAGASEVWVAVVASQPIEK